MVSLRGGDVECLILKYHVENNQCSEAMSITAGVLCLMLGSENSSSCDE